MSYLNNTLNMLDDDEILESVEAMELRVVNSINPDDISYPDEDSSLILVAMDPSAITIHSFDDDIQQVGEIVESLLSTGYLLSWRDGLDSTEFDTLDDLFDWLSNTKDAPLYADVLESLEDLL